MVNLVRQCLVVEMRDRPSPVELLEHAIFSHSNTAAMGTRAAGSTGKHPVPPSLASCGLLIRDFNDLHDSRIQCRSRHQPTMRDLALRRYLRTEGKVHSLAEAWTSPI
jgi:hypothetical protein